MKNKTKFDFIADMGHEMLRSGGEIFRTEEVMVRVAESFGIEEFTCFVVANGIFLSAVMDEDYYGKVLHVPISPMNLTKIDELNTLSREIVAHKVTPERAQMILQKIKHRPTNSIVVKMLAYGIGSACFCYLFGGGFFDAGLSGIAGLFLALYFTYFVPKLNLGKAVMNILASSLVTLYACLLTQIFPDVNIDTIIIGGIISLVPGVPLVTGFRYLFSDDFSSGMIRLTDALLIALCISVGVGSMLKIWSWL